MMTIVNLAQDFIGSNNINLLMPNGQFGTRDQGGKDHASARYIFTELSPMSRALFHPGDDPLLNYLKDDTADIEPEWYMPILPLVLVNGAEGIGTGWSTNVPCYNPVDIVANIRRRMNDEEMVPMLPWWRGFKGTIRKTGEHKYDVTGIINKINDTTVEITELPIHKWTQNYKQELEAMMGEKGDGPVKDYKEYHDNMNVHFVVTLDEKGMEKAEAQGLHEFFKLTGKINTSNMMCFDFDGKIKKYNSPEEIIEEFYPIRLAWYQKRKDHMAEQLQLEFERLTNQARFISMIVSKDLVVSGRKRADVIADLRKKEFRPFPKISKAKAAGETEEVVENDDAEEDESNDGSHDYDYLLNMAIYSLTKERIEKLKKQAADKEAELLKLLEMTPIQMWNIDLDNFLEQWQLDYQSWVDKAIEPGQVAKKSKRKQPTLAAMMKKAAKKEAGDEDDGDDDFKPGKAGGSKARKALDSKPVKKPASAAVKAEIKDEESEDDYVKPIAKKPPAKKASAKKVKSEEEDSEDDYVKPAPKKAPAKKTPLKIESESEVEMIEEKKPTPPAKRKKPAVPDDSDSDIEVTTSKGKGKAKAAPAKRKSPGSDAGSDDEVALKPAKKKAATEKPLTDFFSKAQPKPAPTARKASGSTQASKAKAPVKKATKKVVESDDDDVSMDDAPPSVPKRSEAPRRAARAAPKAYIDISDDDGGSGSEFEDFD